MLLRFLSLALLFLSLWGCQSDTKSGPGQGPGQGLPPSVAVSKEAAEASLVGAVPDSAVQMYLPPGFRPRFVNNMAEVRVLPGFVYIGTDASTGNLVTIDTKIYWECNAPAGADAAQCLPMVTTVPGAHYSILACMQGPGKSRCLYTEDGTTFKELANGGFVRADFGVRIATLDEVLPRMHFEYYRHFGLAKALDRFLRQVKGNRISPMYGSCSGAIRVPPDSVMVMLNVAGLAITAMVPAAAVQDGVHAIVDDFYCECKAATGSVKVTQTSGLGGVLTACQTSDCSSAIMRQSSQDRRQYPVFKY